MFFEISKNILRAAVPISKYAMPRSATSVQGTLRRNLSSSSVDKAALRRLEGQRAIVTGGSQGIGRAIALGYAKEGAHLVLTYCTNEQSALDVVKEAESFDVKARAVKFDLNEAADAASLKEQAVDFMGGVDILVNNAAFTKIRPTQHFLAVTEKELQALIRNYLIGPIHLTQTICRQMISQKSEGCIINVSTIGGKVSSTPAMLFYEVAKAGLDKFTRGLAIHLAQHDIRVNSIVPGVVETDALKGVDEATRKVVLGVVPLGRFAQPHDLKEVAILFALNKCITGAEIVVDGGSAVSSFFPREMVRELNNRALWENPENGQGDLSSDDHLMSPKP